jgi:ABC-2 type transport system permease protein
MNLTVLRAIFRRDFVSYFSNPTGYVFICVFVVLSALAAFWPPDFFSNNLANLDQLSKWLPFILLVYIPAITMSIWAEERRQHTDELLLTLPASDLDVVVGKYLAGVAIYTVALLFSMFSIYLVFMYGLGTPDTGLFVGTFIGYWFVGIAMLAIGMVASFLTSNLTVGFILGMVFNLPLAMFGVADWIIKNPQLAQAVKRWSALDQFRDFERGVISLGGISYFVMIAVVMLYISMVLIGRRHWGGREEEQSMWAHYLARTLGLIAFAIGINIFLAHHNSLRADVTSENLNSLSPQTVELIKKIGSGDDAKTIKIDAYVSPQVPAEFVEHKLNLLSTLNEMSSLSGGKILVEVHEIENFSEEAANAEKAFGIELREVETIDRGARKIEEVFLGVVMTSGLDREVIKFIDKGVPIEYELLRSICTVSNQRRKTLGVVDTDYPLFGRPEIPFMQEPTEDSQLVTELKKQYDVVRVNPSNEIKDKYDVLLAVQPSSLNPAQMQNFVNAVKAGQPTAIFEDPFPLPQLGSDVAGTAQPKRPRQNPMGFDPSANDPERTRKGDISLLWKLLGIEMRGNEVVWQNFNPEPKLGGLFSREWVFIDKRLATEEGPQEPFSPDSPISTGMQQVLFLLPGSLKPVDGTKLTVDKLAVTGNASGTIDIMDRAAASRPGPFIVAAHIKGVPPSDADLYLSTDKGNDGADKPAADASAKAEPLLDAKSDEKAKAAGPDKSNEVQDKSKEADPLAGKQADNKPIDVVLVTDVDWISTVFFRFREMGQIPNVIVDFKSQNVVFALNVLDVLAGDNRFIDVRKRTRFHQILTGVENATKEELERASEQQAAFRKDMEDQVKKLNSDYEKKMSDLRGRTDMSILARNQQIEKEEEHFAEVFQKKLAALQNDYMANVKRSERELAAEIRGVQDRYKLLAVLLPPIPPILLAFFVYFHRRQAEQEGVDTRRLRFGKVPHDDAAKQPAKVEH